MKCVVIACKNLIEFAELREVEENVSAEELKIQLSDRLTNLMTVAKTYASNNDISSCEPLVTAADDLSSVVMELIETVAEKVVIGAATIVVNSDIYLELPELKVMSWIILGIPGNRDRFDCTEYSGITLLDAERLSIRT
jgi:hypothetical protein